MKNYIKLQDAYITQITGHDGRVTDWVVYGADGEELGRLPAKLDEKEAMACLRFARRFELAAWNEGIQFGKRRRGKTVNPYQAEIVFLRSENVKLAEALDKLTTEGVD